MAEEQAQSTHAPESGVLLALEEAVHSLVPDDLLRAASAPELSDDLALTLLRRADLPPRVIEKLSQNRSVLKYRRVAVALASHPQAPRHVSLQLIRQLYTFDLLAVALSPAVPGDVKRVADETLITRLKTITTGERLTIARRGSGAIAAMLVLDVEERIMRTALENARLNEASVVQAILKPQASSALIQTVSQHAKWSLRRDVQIALLRTEHLSLARALIFARCMPQPHLREILQNSHLPRATKEALIRENSKG